MNSFKRVAWLIPIAILALTACNPNNQATDNQTRATQYQPFQRDGQVRQYDQLGPDDRYHRGTLEPRRDNRRTQTYERRDTGLGFGNRAPETNDYNNAEAQEIAERLVKLATEVENVNDATAVVIGRWAVVGIDVDAKLDRSRVGSIKYSVAEALKADPKGAYAVVTADVDTNQRLREMAREIRQGRPVAGFMDELAAIVGRLMPQVPRQIQEPEQNRDNQQPRS